LQALAPRVIVLVHTETGAADMPAALLKNLPAAPIEVHNLQQEIQKMGSDMFIALAVENMRIFLVGGLLLALIAILAVAMANYTEDQRTYALLRIRGASPAMLWRFLMSMLLSPGLLGMLLGGSVALLAGFGLTNYVWKLRELKTVVQILPTHLVISSLTVITAVLLLIPLAMTATIFSLWVFRRSAREGMQEG
jgi:predicted lysophospholipase L1 biosynthesis ABC-type transport system permease subunit